MVDILTISNHYTVTSVMSQYETDELRDEIKLFLSELAALLSLLHPGVLVFYRKAGSTTLCCSGRKSLTFQLIENELPPASRDPIRRLKP